MRTAIARSTTTPHAPVADRAREFRATVGRHTASFKDLLRAVRSRTTARQQIEYARAAAKSVLSSIRCKAVEIVIALVVDLAHRSEHVEDAEAPGLALAAIARAEWAATHPTTAQRLMSWEEASLLEELAQGEMENAEKALDLYPNSLTHRLRLREASAKYGAAKRIRDEALQRDLARFT